MTPDELLTTTRTVRRRLDLKRPVPLRIVEQCLRLAFQAPNGANAQDWGWVVVEDSQLRQQMAELYREGYTSHQARNRSGEIADPITPQARQRSRQSTAHLVENLHRVPVLVVPAIGRRYGDRTTFQQASKWGSILPAVWSFQLALHTRGLVSAWTTLHLYREEAMAELLAIPHPAYTQAGLFPVAYPVGTTFKPADRSLAQSKIFWNQWGATNC
jgi:nitroreductase